MPLVNVSHKPKYSKEVLLKLSEHLPGIVSEAVDCPEEPFDGPLQPGDIIIRFLPALAPDEALDWLIEVRTKWTKSRDENLRERSENIKSALVEVGLKKFGVWIEIPRAAWSQD